MINKEGRSEKTGKFENSQDKKDTEYKFLFCFVFNQTR